MAPSSASNVLKHEMELVSCDPCRSGQSEPVIRQWGILLEVTKGESTIVRCGQCGLIYLNPRCSKGLHDSYYPTVQGFPVQAKVRSQLQQQAKNFSAKMKRWVLEDYYGYPAVGSAEWFQTLRRIFLWLDKVLREFNGDHPLPWRKAGKVLVVGYGAGGNLKTLHDQGWGVSGNEVREEAAAHARALTGGTIHTGTLGFHIFAPNTFDLSLMRRLAEHFPSLTDALRLVHALLKDEGLLVVSVPNVNSIEAKLLGWSWFYWDPSRHFYHFGKDSLTPFLIQAGFRPYRFRTGVDSLFFMASLDRCWKQRFHAVLPRRMLIDRLLVRPFCLLASHVGFGTEITGHVGKPVPQGNHGGA